MIAKDLQIRDSIARMDTGVTKFITSITPIPNSGKLRIKFSRGMDDWVVGENHNLNNYRVIRNGEIVKKPKIASRCADLSNSVWYEFGYASERYRVADLQGYPVLEQLVHDSWVLVKVTRDMDILISGIATLAKRLHRAELFIEHTKKAQVST